MQQEEDTGTVMYWHRTSVKPTQAWDSTTMEVCFRWGEVIANILRWKKLTHFFIGSEGNKTPALVHTMSLYLG